ncbi:hypothetical protein BGP_4156 [Beggiatoa sp. PS]|nr:hypothetical protein BGP_4156 [Beggiatoa sp. PS]
MKQRQQVLQALVTFSQPLDVLSQALSRFEWDYEGEPVIIEPFHLSQCAESLDVFIPKPSFSYNTKAS